MTLGAGLSNGDSAASSRRTGGDLPSPLVEKGEGHRPYYQNQQRHRGPMYTESQRATEGSWTCWVVLLTFACSAASMTLVLGVCGSTGLVLGPNSSRLFDANSLIVPSMTSDDGFRLSVKLSKTPQWITLLFGSAVATCIVLLALKVLNYFCHDNSRHSRASEPAPERAPLISDKDDGISSLGSSYDSISSDEIDVEDQVINPSQTKIGKLKNVEENDSCFLCTICLDADKDCFFLPCGHCASCFACGIRILEEGDICPECRRRIKKVKKIFKI